MGEGMIQAWEKERQKKSFWSRFTFGGECMHLRGALCGRTSPPPLSSTGMPAPTRA